MPEVSSPDTEIAAATTEAATNDVTEITPAGATVVGSEYELGVSPPGPIEVLQDRIATAGVDPLPGLKGVLDEAHGQLRDAAPGGQEKASEEPYYFENLTSEEVTEDDIREMCAIFEETFANDWPEFAVCQPCGKQMGAAEAYGLPAGTRVPLSLIKTLKRMPICSCGDTMELFIDPDKTYQNIKEKLSRGAHVTLLRSKKKKEEGEQESKKGPILGFTFGYEATLQDAFDKEWKYRFSYTKTQTEHHTRDNAKFLADVIPLMSQQLTQQLGMPVEVGPESNIYCWNCGIMQPEVRNEKIFSRLLQSFFNFLPPDKVRSLATVAETRKEPHLLGMARKFGYTFVEGIMDDDYVMGVNTMGNLHNIICGSYSKG